SAIGPLTALESKYVAYSTFGLLSAYLGLACLPGARMRRIATGLTVVVSLGLVVANFYGWQACAGWQKRLWLTQYQIQTFEIQPPETLDVLFFPARVRETAAYLRATGMGPFRDRVDALMAPRWREAAPTAPITRDTPLNAHVLCPVDTLEDV